MIVRYFIMVIGVLLIGFVLLMYKGAGGDE